MRHGGSGIVTGPAIFEVEPGVKEAYSFTPVPNTSQLNVNMTGGFNITGAEGASPGVVDEAVRRMVDSLEEAVHGVRVRGWK